MALEPITRQEKIIAGQDLTPITRMEKFLKEYGGGGSGLPSGGTPYQQLVTDGEGNAKWENRLAYETDLVETEIIPQTTVAFTKDGGLMVAHWPENFDLVYGQNYKISWDGVDYICTGVLFNDIVPVLGNLGLAGAGEDTGEPFLFMNQGQWAVGSTESATEHIIGIREFSGEVVKIDEKYLPKYSVVYSGDPNNWSNTKKQQMYYDFISGKLVLYLYAEGKICIVLSVFYSKNVGLNFAFFTDNILREFNGTAFSNSIKLTESGINRLIQNQINNTNKWKLYSANYPEVSVGDLLSMYVAFDSTTKKACIYTEKKEDYGTKIGNSTIVTNGDSDIVLSSSTPDSTKKFRITVDDSGTISATEV